jgi:hypothetical protein
MDRKQSVSSDAQWYCTHGQLDGSDTYYEIFFRLCRRYGISWTKASPGEKHFIEALTNYEFDKWKARSQGLDVGAVEPPFHLG